MLDRYPAPLWLTRHCHGPEGAYAVQVDELRVRPMSAEEFESFRERAIRDYAAENVRAGNWSPDQAEALAAKQTDELLPDGVETDGVLLLMAETSPTDVVGLVWVALEGEGRGEAWIYDIEIVPEHRGRGYGRALLRAAEQEVHTRGCRSIGLNVFGRNTIARQLYESSGYEVTSVHMRKRLAGESSE
jgi:ribosomal protein S18 acetylase RimI-like enzyme